MKSKLKHVDALAVRVVQSRFAETLTLTLNPNFGESGRHRAGRHYVMARIFRVDACGDRMWLVEARVYESDYLAKTQFCVHSFDCSQNHRFCYPFRYVRTAPSKTTDRLSSVSLLMSMESNSGAADARATVTWPSAEVEPPSELLFYVPELRLANLRAG